LAPWLFGGLAERELPVVCIEVRQMKAFAKASPIKMDRRDARLIAQAMHTGLFKIAHVKTDYTQRIRLLLRHRQAMVRRNKDLINTVRCTLKAFGIALAAERTRCSPSASARPLTTRSSWP
jgi:transposase